MIERAAPTYPRPRLTERALDLLFPPTCAGCRRPGRWLCNSCWQRMPWLVPAHCGLCNRRWTETPCTACRTGHSALDTLTAVTQFEGVARECVHGLKYEGHHAIGGMMGALMAGAVREVPASLVVAVSLHPRRRRERGYDQAAVLARVVARCLDTRVEVGALRRLRPTKQQARLDAAGRRKNVEGAFAATRDLRGEDVLLVDDVMTTGATLEAAAEAVRAAGAETVNGLVFAWAR